MAEKEKTVTTYIDGFKIRTHNKRIVATENESGEGYNFQIMYCNDNEEEKPTCSYRRVRGVDCTGLGLSKEALLDILYAMSEYEKEKKNNV